MGPAEALSAIGCFLGGTAAWAAYLSPRARAQRRAKEDKARHDREVHEGLYGKPARYDESGALITPGQAGLLADMQSVMRLPILNGRGTVALAKIDSLDEQVSQVAQHVDRIDRRTRAIGGRLTSVERNLADKP